MLGYLSVSCFLLLLVNTIVSIDYDAEYDEIAAAPEPIPFERVEIVNIDLLTPQQKADIVGALRSLSQVLPRHIQNDQNLSLVDDVFTENASLLCSGRTLHSKEAIRSYIKKGSHISAFSINQAYITLNRGGLIRCRGHYSTNQGGNRYFNIYFIEENGHYKIDEALLTAC